VEYSQIIYDVDDPVATITLNRPGTLNAWTSVMDSELRSAVSEAAADPRVVAIVLTGAGRGFCSGADMSLLGSVARKGSVRRSSDPWEVIDGDVGGRFSFLMGVDKPVIAAINGPVAGMGVALALCCDLRFMSSQAYITTAFARRGLIAEWGAAWLLPRLIGSASALDLLFSSRRVLGDEAARIGLANEVVDEADLLPRCRSYVEDLAEHCSPTSIAVMKAQVYSELHRGLGAAEVRSYEVMDESLRSDDFREGVAAYREGRPPRFGRRGLGTESAER
jgi:enoyl-CoA hydratase/carnithine racemase